MFFFYWIIFLFIGFEKLRKHRRGRKHSKLRSPFFSPCPPLFPGTYRRNDASRLSANCCVFFIFSLLYHIFLLISYRIKIYSQYHYAYCICTLYLYLIYLHLIYLHLIYLHLIYLHLIYLHLIIWYIWIWYICIWYIYRSNSLLYYSKKSADVPRTSRPTNALPHSLSAQPSTSNTVTYL